MKEKVRRYQTSLLGMNNIEYHLEQLKSDLHFQISIDKHKEPVSFEVHGPKRDSSKDELSDITNEITKRATELGLDVPELADSTSRSIYEAGLAERQVIKGKMYVSLTSHGKGTKADVTLLVRELDIVDTTYLDYYAYWRIICLSQSLNMIIKGTINKS